MNFPRRIRLIVSTVILAISSWGLRAATLDDVGLTALRAVTTNLNGDGIAVAQTEAALDYPANTQWQVNPGNFSHLAGRFTFTSDLGSTNVYPNSVGAYSWHADSVGESCYGQAGGVATNLARVDNIEANHFINFYVVSNLAVLSNPIVNQSFTFGNVTNATQTNGSLSISDQQEIDSLYDNYAAQHGTLFVSAINNQYSVSPPGTAYNSIGVGAYGNGAASSVGPTLDNGRCKPDLTAPAGHTSFSTPEISGAAAVLMQAALRGDGGADTNAAFDLRTIKALLLNGAVKPADWTNGSATPLDAHYGAGVMNILNSYEQLAGGKHGSIVSNLVSTLSGGAHPPTGAPGTVAVLSGWDFATNTSTIAPASNAICHYYFNVSNSLASVKFTAAATLVWNRHYNPAYLISPIGINNLNLFLYDCTSSNLVASSISAVDNVEHLYVTNLAQGRYDLQVWKAGGAGIISTAEPYALAWEFTPPPELLISGGTAPALNWPVYPAGFLVEARTNLLSGAWSTNGSPVPLVTNGLNSIRLDTTNAAQFFRLRKPNL